jgi:hypothetical protein
VKTCNLNFKLPVTLRDDFQRKCGNIATSIVLRMLMRDFADGKIIYKTELKLDNEEHVN